MGCYRNFKFMLNLIKIWLIRKIQTSTVIKNVEPVFFFIWCINQNWNYSQRSDYFSESFACVICIIYKRFYRMLLKIIIFLTSTLSVGHIKLNAKDFTKLCSYLLSPYFFVLSTITSQILKKENCLIESWYFLLNLYILKINMSSK